MLTHSEEGAWRVAHRRLRAIAKQNRRGNKHASGEREFEIAKSHLSSLIHKYQKRLQEVETLQRMAKSPMATFVAELSPPEGYEVVAVFDGDEVSVCYENEETDDIIDVDWPFSAGYVWPDDCEALGIRVVHA